MNEYIAAFDIAKKRDKFSGLVFRRTPDFLKDPDGKSREFENLDIVHIEQHGNLQYEEMAEIVDAVMNIRELARNTDLLVDGTGVGDAVIEGIQKKGLSPNTIIFSGGQVAHQIQPPAGQIFKESKEMLVRRTTGWTVPKKDLVAAGQIVIQQGHVRLAPNLRWGPEFTKQLEGFKKFLNENTMNTKYEAESEFLHDDLVVCFLMACWFALNHKQGTMPRDVPAHEEKYAIPDFDPIKI